MTVIEVPKLITAPVSPKLSFVIAAFFVGGLSMACGLVMLLDSLDDRFRSVEEMQGRLGLPLLTMLQPLTAPEKTGPMALVTHALPTSAGSEGFRTLRTALTLTYPDARRIVRDKHRTKRREDDHAGQLGGLLRPSRQADTVDRRRPAAPRLDRLDEHARAARTQRGSPVGSRYRADGARCTFSPPA